MSKVPIMLERGGQDALAVSPTVLVSAPAEERANIVPRSTTLAGRRRSKPESFALAEPGRRSANEWIDIDDHEPAVHCRRPSKRRATASHASQKSRNEDLDFGRFLPRLGRILESTDNSSGSKPHKKARKPRRKPEKSAHRNKEVQGEAYHRPMKQHRVGGLSKQNQTTLNINPSLLSVISGLTGISDSSSNTTITQQSYNNRSDNSNFNDSGIKLLHRRSGSAPVPSSPQTFNVFDYMESPSMDDAHDSGSECSSRSSSHYSPSDAGSSDSPQTPSSNSTFPSPTATRSGSLTGSVTEHRQKYDVHFAEAVDSPINSRHGSVSGAESLDKRRRRSIAVHSGSDCSTRSTQSKGDHTRRRSRATHTEEQKSDAMPPYVPQPPVHHGSNSVQPVYGQYRSPSISSAESAGSRGAYAHYMSMQHYQHPSAPAHVSFISSQPDDSGYIAHPDRPPVPDAPDLSLKTLAGYEMLAQELASPGSPVKPVYRKFEYLNHRILLHLQDELCEMEEQLRTTDEIIAQRRTPADDGHRMPASRRGDAFGGSEIHHHRTALLGRIFLKTEQYNRAMSSFALLAQDSSPAKSESVASYRKWMAEKSPIHDKEAKFLQNEHDLVEPGKLKEAQPALNVQYQKPPSKHAAALSCLPVALMLPLLLYSVIPTLAGRLVVTMLIGIGVFLVAATTRIRHMMGTHEWAVCGGAYVLIMAAISGCIPQHAA